MGTIIMESSPSNSCRGRNSRSEPNVWDMQRFKSVTLDRMGKMMKMHSKLNEEKSEIMNSSRNKEDMLKKYKFNSLSRMLKLSNKDEKAQPVEQHRGRSLTRFFQRKMLNEGDNVQAKSDERIRGIFSRILGQIRGRITKHNSSANHLSQKAMDNPISLPTPSVHSGRSNLSLKSLDPEINSYHQA
ncbi:PREDICTED: uncharacterized protein LOC105364914 [Ceratosolen solmsi marchali]|uniref:Uncharacterized protein LOC105364914 n=1 Tax=Ceratosolen solmsi marchali TaxID=326594 RepID=A0AAJ6YNF6_9HYME|nr:PREDICTED: uncharacterized protein LOC105364914 [Ceratosolen solmsi marchali]